MENKIEELNRERESIMGDKENFRGMPTEDKDRVKEIDLEISKLQSEIVEKIKDSELEEESNSTELSDSSKIIYNNMLAEHNLRNGRFNLVQKYARVIDEEIKELEKNQKLAKNKFESLDRKFTKEDNDIAFAKFLEDKSETIKDRNIGLGIQQLRTVRNLIR